MTSFTEDVALALRSRSGFSFISCSNTRKKGIFCIFLLKIAEKEGKPLQDLLEYASALNIVKDLKGSAEMGVVKRWRGECAMAGACLRPSSFFIAPFWVYFWSENGSVSDEDSWVGFWPLKMGVCFVRRLV